MAGRRKAIKRNRRPAESHIPRLYVNVCRGIPKQVLKKHGRLAMDVGLAALGLMKIKPEVRKVL